MSQLSADGSKLIYSTDLGISPDSAVHGITLDPTGNVYLTGTSGSPQFPSFSKIPNLGLDFVLALTAQGAAQSRTRLPAGTIIGSPVFDTASQNLLLVSAQVAILQLPAASATAAPASSGPGSALGPVLSSIKVQIYHQ